MVNEPKSVDGLRQSLSALADGDVSTQALRQLTQVWQHDAEARACWHAYQVVGDVMRSDELAAHVAGDAAFVRRLRARLALEPVPLATAALAPLGGAAPADAAVGAAADANASPAVSAAGIRLARRRYRLLAPAAVAAGFVAVAGALVVFRGAGVAETGPRLAALKPDAAGPAVGNVQRVVGYTVLRDARLDRYLHAHRRQSPDMLAAPGSQGQAIQVVFEQP